jgi:uncharacterized membrane protein
MLFSGRRRWRPSALRLGRWAAAALLAGALGATPGRAASPGDRIVRQIDLGGKQVPLPGGEWTLAAIGTQTFAMPSIGAFGAIKTAVLFLVQGDRVAAVLEINSNALPVNDGWGRTASCADDARPFLLIKRYNTGWETSCLFVRATNVAHASGGPTAWDQARAFAERSGLTMPRIWLSAGFRISDRQDLIDARYHFAPSLLLGASAEALDRGAAWSAAAVTSDPLRLGAVQAVSTWAAGFDFWIERGLHNQIGVTPGSMQAVTALLPGAQAVDAKLLALDRLYRDGRIGWEAYAAQSAAATMEVPVVLQRTSLLSNAVQKNLSFRSFGTFVDYGIAYLVTANTAISWGIALTLNATDSVWFVLNDQYWDRYYARLNTHDSERLVDFIYVGQEVEQ